jgi:hypothetical protein
MTWTLGRPLSSSGRLLRVMRPSATVTTLYATACCATAAATSGATAACEGHGARGWDACLQHRAPCILWPTALVALEAVGNASDTRSTVFIRMLHNCDATRHMILPGPTGSRTLQVTTRGRLRCELTRDSRLPLLAPL